MGIFDSIKGQFIDVIEYTDENSKTIIKKYIRGTSRKYIVILTMNIFK